MSLLPYLDEKLITKGWARVATGQPVKGHYQFYSLLDSQWCQCGKYSPKIVKYESLYRKPISLLAWVNVIWKVGARLVTRD